jgi:gliding motility-associated-like protein
MFMRPKLNFSVSKIVCLLLVIVIIYAGDKIYAQSYLRKENNIWVGGGDFWATGFAGSGLNFNSGNVQASHNSWNGNLYDEDNKGAASICDGSGKLLFYTDGTIIWNRNHSVMQDGWDINNNGNMLPNTYFIDPYSGGSAFNRDGVVIVPMPGSSHKYYIFTSPLLWNPPFIYPIFFWEGRIYATVVDMELNNGLGGVVAGQRGRVIAENMSGNLHAVIGEDCNYWLLAYNAGGSYHAYNITDKGVDTIPVVSTLSPLLSSFVGELNVSPDRKKLAMAAESEVQVCNFNAATGSVSNDILYGAQGSRFVCFSPNSTLMYLSGIIGVRQYDLNAPATPLNLLTINNLTAFEMDSPLRLGPDNKIYLSYLGGNNAVPAYIQQPDVLGTGCQLSLFTATSLPALEILFPSLPNEIPVRVYDTVSKTMEMPLCFGRPVILTPGVINGTDYHWMVNTGGTNYLRKGNDTSSVLSAALAGKYAVQYYTSNPCQFHRDTFLVNAVSFSLYLGEDQSSCDGRGITLDTKVPAAVYQWSDGSSGQSLVVKNSDTYWVNVTREGCTASDTINVIVADFKQDIGPDQVLCLEGGDPPALLKASVPNGASVLWSNGAVSDQILVSDTGNYWVRVYQGGCEGLDTAYVDKQYCDCPMLFPNAFSPNGDGINDVFQPSFTQQCPVLSFKMQIFNRWGALVYVSYKPGEGWNGYYANQPADAGTYMYRIEMKTGLKEKVTLKKGDLILIR